MLMVKRARKFPEAKKVRFGSFEFGLLKKHLKMSKIPKHSQFRAAKMVKMAVFDLLKSAKIDFT